MNYKSKFMNGGPSSTYFNFSIPRPQLPSGEDVVIGSFSSFRSFENNTSARGIVITPPITLDGNMVSTRPMDLDELRMAALFWDRIALPTTNIMAVGLGEAEADVNFLKETGLLDTPRGEIQGLSGNPAWAIVAAQRQLFETLEAINPGQWAVGTGENSPVFTPGNLAENRGLLFKLTDALPVPTRAVHLSDILEFKERRRAELLSLRAHLEETYQAIRAAPDRPLAECTAFTQLDGAASDYVKAQLETGFPLKTSNLGVKLDAGMYLMGAAAGGVALQAGLPMTQAALAALGGAALRV